MATIAAASTCSTAQFVGLRAVKVAQKASLKARTSMAVGKARTTCYLDTFPVVVFSTGASLFLGRFAFLPIQSYFVTEQGLPTQNGVTHAEAGDTRAVEVVGFLKTNDPAGFTLVDVLAWGAIGHAVAFFILATSSNGYEPKF
jgi:photosystem I subunit V